MVRGKRRVGAGERLAGRVILCLLAALTAWLFVEQSRFNPAVLVSLRPPLAAPPAPSVSAESGSSGLLGDLPELSPLGPAETFDAETLSDKINGKAELYLSSNFKELVCRRYALTAETDVRLEISLYVMESPRDAYAVFSRQRRPGAADSGAARHAYATDNALFLAQGRHYLEIIADHPLADPAERLAPAAAALLAAAPSPEAEDLAEPALFPRPGLRPESIRLTVSDAFGLEGLNNIFTADYQLDGGEAAAFLSLRPDAAEAKALADDYATFLTANGYREEPPAGAPGGARVFSLDNSWEVVMIRGRALAGAHDALTPQAALELALALESSLRSIAP